MEIFKKGSLTLHEDELDSDVVRHFVLDADGLKAYASEAADREPLETLELDATSTVDVPYGHGEEGRTFAVESRGGAMLLSAALDGWALFYVQPHPSPREW